MKRPQRRLIPQRRRVFLGCEGESERGYAALLRNLLNERGFPIHLDVVLLKPGGGDPLTLVQRAQRQLAESRRRNEPPYFLRAILLDSDQRGRVPERDALVLRLAHLEQIQLIWQEPCHEAFLLRHLEGCEMRRPQTSAQALDELRRRWPGFDKGLPAMRLAERIGEPEIRRAMKVEPDLAAFLRLLAAFD